MIKAKWTRRKSVRFDNGLRKWYRAVLDQNHRHLRTSRKIFKRARDAEAYQQQVLGRLERLRNVVQ
jgi:hypothetical protein